MAVRSARGRRMPRPATLAWTSSDTSKATVDRATGRVHARSPGAVRIEVADSSGVKTGRMIAIVPAPVAVVATALVEKKDTLPPPKRLELADALGPAARCREAFVNVDAGAIRELGTGGTAEQLENQRVFLKHLNDNPRVVVKGTGGPDYVDGREDRASVQYSLRLLWRPSGRLRRGRDEPFGVGATLHSDGKAWHLTGCHVLYTRNF